MKSQFDCCCFLRPFKISISQKDRSPPFLWTDLSFLVSFSRLKGWIQRGSLLKQSPCDQKHLENSHQHCEPFWKNGGFLRSDGLMKHQRPHCHNQPNQGAKVNRALGI